MWEVTSSPGRTTFPNDFVQVLTVEVDTETGTVTVTLDTPIAISPDFEQWSINSNPCGVGFFGAPGDDSFSASLEGVVAGSGTVEWTGAGITFIPPNTLLPGSMPYP